MKVAIVVPCHIPPSEGWIAALKSEADANKAQVIIVDDSDGKLGELPAEWEVMSYLRQEAFLEELYPEFDRLFHKSSSCRIVGHLRAYQAGFDIVIGLDSDCIVKRHFVRDHIQFLGKDYGGGWFNPIGNPNFSRGFPYSQRSWPVVANMGLWENVLDINGKDRQANEPKEIKIAGSTVPERHFPFSGMNFAMLREAVPGFLFLPNFDYGDSKFRRIDDIWGGYIFQKLMRLKHQSAMVGYPFVYHDTIVNAEEDAAEEAAMYLHEEGFIYDIDTCFQRMADDSLSVSYAEAYRSFAHAFDVNATPPFRSLKAAFDWWVAAIEKYA